MTSKERIDKALQALGMTASVEDTEVFRAEVNRAFRVIAKRDHPDKNPADPTAKSRFVAAKEAREVLLRASRGEPIGETSGGTDEEEEILNEDSQAAFEEDVISMLEALADELKKTQIALGKLRLEVRSYRNQANSLGEQVESLKSEVSGLKRALKLKAAGVPSPGRPAVHAPPGSYGPHTPHTVGFSGTRANPPMDDEVDPRLSWDPEGDSPSGSDFLDDVSRVVRTVFGRGKRRSG